MVANLSICGTDGSGLDTTGAVAAKEKEYPLCIVKWRDIIACSGWERERDVECPIVYSVGWLISQTDQTVKIATTLDYDDFTGEAKEECKPIPYGITAFPAGVVLDITYIPLGSFSPSA